MLLPLVSLSILSMSLTACGRNAPEPARIEFLTPQIPLDELICMAAPTGQLPVDATNEQVAQRVTGIDEAGEDCRQRLNRARIKLETFNEVVAEINAANEKARQK